MPQVLFVSNYINHHQIPFCNAMRERLGDDFLFIQTEEMERERRDMGWEERDDLPYVRYFYRQPDECANLIMESQVVIFGGTDDESYIEPRLEAGLSLVRYSERLYKTGQWKAPSPRGLRKKYHDHTRYRNKPVYLLCAGAYVPSDFHIIRAYPGKMYRWGYFPETRYVDEDELMAKKGAGKVRILWAARFIDWKHPEIAVRLADTLKKKGISFEMEMIGGGQLLEETRKSVKELHLEDVLTLSGVCSPDEVRDRMETADIFVVTSDRMEGWGAVINEAMNSGCAVVADHMEGAAPYLITPGRNGEIYRDGDEEMLLNKVEKLCLDGELRQRMGREAYRSIVSEWNADTASERLLTLFEGLGLLESGREAGVVYEEGPCSPAPVIGERAMAHRLFDTGRSEKNG